MSGADLAEALAREIRGALGELNDDKKAVVVLVRELREELVREKPIAAGIVELLRRTGWKKINEPSDMPQRQQHCLIWQKGAEHPTVATCNLDARDVKYFLLGNSGTLRRAMDEVSHWMPLPAGPVE